MQPRQRIWEQGSERGLSRGSRQIIMLHVLSVRWAREAEVGLVRTWAMVWEGLGRCGV